jgi:ubiquitin-conjugating enzyme E2 variant
MFLLEGFLVVLFVDFLSGLVHWAEDTFWIESTPVLGVWLVKPNVLHHHDGGAFTRNSWLQSSWDLLLGGITILAIAWYLHFLSWQIWLFVVVGINANQIHKWNHVPKSEVPRWVRVLQHFRVLQSPEHHAAHHRDEKNRCYCVVTELLNPVLDRIGFWRALEQLLVPIFGAPRRDDLCDRLSGSYT